MSQDPGSGMGHTGPAPSGAAEKKKGGCLKWGAIGCGVIVVILIIAAIVVYTQRGKIAEAIGNVMKEKILEALPEEYTAEQADEIMTAFYNAIKEGKLSEADGQKLGTKFNAAFEDGVLNEDETRELLEFMAEAAGIEKELEPPATYEDVTGDLESSEEGTAVEGEAMEDEPLEGEGEAP